MLTTSNFQFFTDKINSHLNLLSLYFFSVSHSGILLHEFISRYDQFNDLIFTISNVTLLFTNNLPDDTFISYLFFHLVIVIFLSSGYDNFTLK